MVSIIQGKRSTSMALQEGKGGGRRLVLQRRENYATSKIVPNIGQLY
jgi:hypothetical protein